MTNNLAFLWWENEVQWDDADRPFVKDWKNKDYASYVELFRERNVTMYVAEYRWLEKDTLKKAWLWDGEEWQKKHDIEVETVYDLFRHDKHKMKLKEQMQDHVNLVNDPEVADLCQDKLKTYRTFPGHVPETAKATTENVKDFLNKYGKAILKPRYGSSGEGIEKITDIEDFEEKQDLLVQRFISDPELSEFDIEGYHDLRIIIINGEIVGGYFRIPQDEEFLSNVAQGASVNYIEREEIPDSALQVLKQVSKYFENYSPVIYTVDFIFEKDKPRIMELNSQPGIYYHQEATRKAFEYPWMKKVVKALLETL